MSGGKEHSLGQGLRHIGDGFKSLWKGKASSRSSLKDNRSTSSRSRSASPATSNRLGSTAGGSLTEQVPTSSTDLHGVRSLLARAQGPLAVEHLRPDQNLTQTKKVLLQGIVPYASEIVDA